MKKTALNRGEGDSDIHKLAFDDFMAGTEPATKMDLRGATQDIFQTALRQICMLGNKCNWMYVNKDMFQNEYSENRIPEDIL